MDLPYIVNLQRAAVAHRIIGNQMHQLADGRHEVSCVVTDTLWTKG